jgi:hypothetical protein
MPHSKLPSALIDGRIIADSSLIIEHLQEHDSRALTDVHLSPLQRTLAEAIKAFVETHLYFVGFYLRWCVDDNFARYRPMLFDYAKRSAPAWQRPMVPLLGPLVLPIIRQQKMRQVWEQGIGRHTYDEVIANWAKWVAGVSDALGRSALSGWRDHKQRRCYWFCFGHTLARHPFPSAVQDFVLGHPDLMAYHARIWQRFWSTGAS